MYKVYSALSVHNASMLYDVHNVNILCSANSLYFSFVYCMHRIQCTYRMRLIYCTHGTHCIITRPRQSDLGSIPPPASYLGKLYGVCLLIVHRACYPPPSTFTHVVRNANAYGLIAWFVHSSRITIRTYIYTSVYIHIHTNVCIYI